MNTKIFETVKVKYPKAYEKFNEYIWDKHPEWLVFGHFCFNDITDFFDKQKVFISIYYDPEEEGYYNFIYDKINKNMYSSGSFQIRDEAEDAATLKAFEILNNIFEGK